MKIDKQLVSEEMLPLSVFLLYPSKPIFCTTKNLDGTDNVAPFAWLMPVSVTPPRVALALQNIRGSKLSASLVNIQREGEFVINLPHRGQETELVQASFMLVNHCCKFDRTGFTREDAEIVAPKIIAECYAALECKVVQVIDVMGDHSLILADVVSSRYSKEYYDEELRPRIPQAEPLMCLRECRFDEKQRHVFVKADSTYEVDVHYEKSEVS